MPPYDGSIEHDDGLKQQVVDAEGISGEVIKVSDLTSKSAFGHRRGDIKIFRCRISPGGGAAGSVGFGVFKLNKEKKAWAR